MNAEQIFSHETVKAVFKEIPNRKNIEITVTFAIQTDDIRTNTFFVCFFRALKVRKHRDSSKKRRVKK